MLRNYLLLTALCTATTISPVTQPAQGSTSTQTTTQADSSKKAKQSVFSRVKTFCCDNKKAIVVCLTVAATGATVYYIVRKMNANQKALLDGQAATLNMMANVEQELGVLNDKFDDTLAQLADIDQKITELEDGLHADVEACTADVINARTAVLGAIDKRIAEIHAHIHENEDVAQAQVQDLHQHLRDSEEALLARLATDRAELQDTLRGDRQDLNEALENIQVWLQGLGNVEAA